MINFYITNTEITPWAITQEWKDSPYVGYSEFLIKYYPEVSNWGYRQNPTTNTSCECYSFKSQESLNIFLLKAR